MRYIKTEIFTFDELSENGRETAINNFIKEIIETGFMNDSEFYKKASEKAEQMRTPWFFGSYLWEYGEVYLLEELKRYYYDKHGNVACDIENCKVFND